jgi:peptidoglycan hydrolase-like protein with peptidoglycan-binding domain
MVPATGYYGNLTTAAVEQFQAAHNLDQLGVVGPATRAALNSIDGSGTGTSPTVPASTTTASGYTFSNFLDVGSTGDDVTALQQKLTTLGDYSGPVTGYFGQLTQAAVEQFQGANGIAQVGYVGPATRAALNQ